MLSDKVSYLKGLMDGLDISDATKEGRILRVIADILEEMAGSIEDVAEEVDEVVELVDIIDKDLGDVEEDLYDFDEDVSEGLEEKLSPAEKDDPDLVTDADYDDFDEEQMYECCCTNCGNTICISESIVKEGSMKCPNCNALLEFNYVEEDDEADK